MDTLTAGAGASLGALAATGTYLDIRYRRLPNWLCGMAFLAGIGFGAALGSWDALLMAVLHSVLALAVGMGLFAIGAVGGGDAKFYAALAVWFPLKSAPLLLGAVSVAGLILLLAWLPWRMRRRRRTRSSFDRNPSDEGLFDKLPYGVAIATGALVAFVMLH